MTKKIILVALALLFVIQPAFSQAPKLGDTAVYLVVEDSKSRSFGTGVTLKCSPPNCSILTVNHLFEGLGKDAKITVTFFRDGQKIDSRAFPIFGLTVNRDKEADLALFVIPISAEYPVARLAPKDYPLSAGTRVVSYGCNAGKIPPTAATCVITAINRYLGAPTIECSGEPVEGRSGGPLFTSDGYLIGICSARDPSEQRGIYAGLSAIHKLLSAAGVILLEDPEIAAAKKKLKERQERLKELRRIREKLEEERAKRRGELSPIRRYGSGKWNVIETANVRIYYDGDRSLAEAAAREVEQYRAACLASFECAVGDWQPKLDVYIHKDRQQYARASGSDPASPGHSSVGVDRGKIISRRIDLQQGGSDILVGVLPHELCHVVLADVCSQAMPRWADEGLAVLREDPSRAEAHLRNLKDFMQRGRLFTAEQLMTMGAYPPSNLMQLFYAESVALVKFFLAKGSAKTFVDFQEYAFKNGYEAALKKYYGINSFDELEKQFKQFINK